MYKINGLLFAALLSISLSCLPGDQDISDDCSIIHPNINPENQQEYDELITSIDILQKENEDLHFRSNICWKTTGSLVLFSAIFNGWGFVFVTEGLAYLYAGIGGYTIMDENEQIKEREAKINDLRSKQATLIQHKHSKLGA